MKSKWWEAWIQLQEQALQGTERAVRALEALGEGKLAAEEWAKWFEPGVGSPGAGGAEELRRAAEDWWEAVGVVPRYRYRQLQQERDELEQQLARAQATIQKLRALLEEKVVGPEAVGEVAKQQWEEAARALLDAQQEWTRTWAEGVFGKEKEEKKPKT